MRQDPVLGDSREQGLFFKEVMLWLLLLAVATVRLVRNRRRKLFCCESVTYDCPQKASEPSVATLQKSDEEVGICYCMMGLDGSKMSRDSCLSAHRCLWGKRPSKMLCSELALPIGIDYSPPPRDYWRFIIFSEEL